MHESRAARERTAQMDRFIHHYQRWSAHRDSAALERQMWDDAVPRLAPVVDEMLAFTGSDHLFGGRGLSFIHAAFMELLESRSMLQHSYAFSYLRYTTELRQGTTLGWKRREKSEFERAQSELELLTEQISDVVARKHIRATQEQIVYLTKATAQKRNDFSNAMVSCLRAEAKEEQEQQQRAHHLRGNGDDDGRGGDDAGNSITAVTRESPARALLRQSLSDLLAENGLAALLEYDSDNDDLPHHRDAVIIEDWMCPACTFVNTGRRRRCEMCHGDRPR
jgi:Ariadne domain/Zn-finger in Ran binding protein and others